MTERDIVFSGNTLTESLHPTENSPFTSPTSEELKQIEASGDYGLDSEELVEESIGQFADNGVRLYLREAAQTPLLSQTDEILLFQKVHTGRKAGRYLERKAQDNGQDLESYERAVVEGLNAREKIIMANVRLVVSIAKKYAVNEDIMDIIQDGNEGLIKAVEGFDPSLGFRFSTYASWWIRGTITHELSKNSRTIRLPEPVITEIKRLIGTQQELFGQLGRDPLVSEIASEMGLKPESVVNLIEWARHPISLYIGVGEDECDSLGDMIPSVPNSMRPTENAALSRIIKEEIEKIIQGFPPRSERVLMLRGLDDRYISYDRKGNEKQNSLGKVGRSLGITRERVRQIEKEIREKTLSNSRSRIFLEELLD